MDESREFRFYGQPVRKEEQIITNSYDGLRSGNDYNLLVTIIEELDLTETYLEKAVQLWF